MIIRVAALTVLLLFVAHNVRADEFASASFKVLDPVLQNAGFATSSNFQLWSTMGEPGQGASTATGFALGGGFLRFPAPTPPGVTTGSGSGGGGIFGLLGKKTSQLTVEGRTSPFSTVVLLRGSVEVARTRADALGVYRAIAENMAGTFELHVYSVDPEQRTSAHAIMPLTVALYPTDVTNLILAPTVRVPASVSVGQPLTVRGYTLRNATAIIAIENVSTKARQNFETQVGDSGAFQVVIPVSALARGTYSVAVQARADTLITPQSLTSRVIVTNASTATSTPAVPPRSERPCTTVRGDLTCDGLVTRADFELLKKWYGKPQPPRGYDLNGDGVVSSADFAIMAALFNRK